MFRWCRQVNASKAHCEMRSIGQWARSSTTICVRVSARCPFSTARRKTDNTSASRSADSTNEAASSMSDTVRPREGGASADTRQQLKHQQRIGSSGLHVSEGAFLYKQCRCLYTEIGLGAQGQTLSPFLPGQFAFDGGENHCTHEGNDIQAWLKCRMAGSWGILSRKGNGCMTCCSASPLLATISETYTALRHFLTACSPCCQHAVGTRRMQGRTMGETGKPGNLGSNVLSMQTSKKHLNARTSVSLQALIRKVRDARDRMGCVTGPEESSAWRFVPVWMVHMARPVSPRDRQSGSRMHKQRPKSATGFPAACHEGNSCGQPRGPGHGELPVPAYPHKVRHSPQARPVAWNQTCREGFLDHGRLCTWPRTP